VDIARAAVPIRAGMLDLAAVLQALAALSALLGIGGALRLIKNARKPRANRRGDQVGGVNVDPTVDWEEYVHD